jgi:hypothetical protein
VEKGEEIKRLNRPCMRAVKNRGKEDEKQNNVSANSNHSRIADNSNGRLGTNTQNGAGVF